MIDKEETILDKIKINNNLLELNSTELLNVIKKIGLPIDENNDSSEITLTNN